MVRAGVDVVRLTFARTGRGSSRARRDGEDIARKVGRTVAISATCRGRDPRRQFKDGKVTLEKGQRFVLDAGLAMGDGERRGSTTRSCRATSAPGGAAARRRKIVARRDRRARREVHTTVRHAACSPHKGINRQGGGLTAPAAHLEDMEDIKTR